MNTVTILCAALFAAPFLIAQDDGAAAPPMGSPKSKAHEPLAHLVGTWTTACRMEPMPGVPGMEQATTWTGSERAELVCNGMWLQCVAESRCGDQATQGLWLTGYEPKQGNYRCLWASSMDEPYMEGDGRYDAATRTWTFVGESPYGRFESVLVFETDDRSVETCSLVGEHGEKTQCMRLVRSRSGDQVPVDAGTTTPKATAGPQAPLAEMAGEWDLVTTGAVPGQGGEKGSERVVPICGGKWFWSDFRGSMMGQPFEAHSLMGYDPTKQQYVSVWIDSVSPGRSLTWGSYDRAGKQLTFTGEYLDTAGKPAQIRKVYRQPDTDTRDLEASFTNSSGTQRMQIHYTRKPK